MAVKHGVTDSDQHFIIDPITRTIKNQSGKLVLIQYDHNSERFTFQCPRLVDGHDMSLCNRVRIHFINVGSGNAKTNGIYEVDDLQVSGVNNNVVTFSWLISQNATRYAGKLNFVIRFACVDEEAVIEYAWNTGVYSDITIAQSIYNGEEFVEDYIDVLEMWKQDLYSEGVKISSVEQVYTSTEDGGVNRIEMSLSDKTSKVFEIRNGTKGDAGVSIESVARTSGDGAPGSNDIYTITMTDGNMYTFQVHNGSNGSNGLTATSSEGMQLIDSTAGDVYKIYVDNGDLVMVKLEEGSDGSGGLQMVDGSAGGTYTVYVDDGKLKMEKVDSPSAGAEMDTPSAFIKTEDVSDSVDDDSSQKVASSKAVKIAYDKAVQAMSVGGDGSGDMTKAVYDPQSKRTDIFKYVDDAVGVCVPVTVEILETICENIVFDNSNPTYTLPSAIALDSDAFYYLDCYYYEGGTSGALNEKYTLHAFTRLSNNMVKWASNNDDKAIILGPIDVVNNWRSPGHTNVVSIYKVKIIQDNPLFIAAMHATGYKTTAPGGYNANAEGHKTIALGYASHAEGRENYALGDYSHAEGAYNYAMGYASHVQGYGTIASSNYQHAEGKFNVTDDAGVYVHIVGNGTSEDSRSNAYTLDWEGNAWFAGNILGKQANVTEQVRVSNDTNSMSIWPNGLAGDPKEGSDESKLWIGSDGRGYFTNLYVTDGEAEKEVATKDDITAAITGAIEGSY